MPKLIRAMLVVLLVTAAVESATAQEAKKDGDDKLFPGAKRLHKFKHELDAHFPILLDAKAGPQLLIRQSESVVEGSKTVQNSASPLLFWDVVESKEVHKISKADNNEWLRTRSALIAGRVSFMALAPDGKAIAYCVSAGSKNVSQIEVYEFATRKSRLLLTKYTTPPPNEHALPVLFFTPDGGTLVVLFNGQCTIQDLDKPKPRQTFKLLRGPTPSSGGFQYIDSNHPPVISPDGSYLAVAAQFEAVAVYDMKTGKVIFQAPHPAGKDKLGLKTQKASARFTAFSASEDEQKLLVVERIEASPKNFILARTFDLKTKKETARLRLGEFMAGGFPPPGFHTTPHAYFNAKSQPRILYDGKLFDVAGGKTLHEFDQGRGLLVSRDGRYIVRLMPSKTNRTGNVVDTWSVDAEK